MADVITRFCLGNHGRLHHTILFRPFDFLALKGLYYLAFKYFYFLHAWWRLPLLVDIYIFIEDTNVFHWLYFSGTRHDITAKLLNSIGIKQQSLTHFFRKLKNFIKYIFQEFKCLSLIIFFRNLVMTQYGVIIVWLIFLLTRGLLIMSWDWLILLALVHLNLVVFVLQVSSSQLACNLLGLAYIASSSTSKFDSISSL